MSTLIVRRPFRLILWHVLNDTVAVRLQLINSPMAVFVQIGRAQQNLGAQHKGNTRLSGKNTTSGSRSSLHGLFGVLSSALAIFFSIYTGITINFAISAACYAGTLIYLRQISLGVAPGHSSEPS